MFKRFALLLVLCFSLSPSVFAEDQLEPLRRQLQDPKPKTRLQAIKALDKLGSQKAKVAFKDLLWVSVWDKDRSNRFEAYLVSRHLEKDPKTIIQACLEAYIDNKAALAWAGGQRDVKWLPSLISMTKRRALGSDTRPDSNDFIALAAAKALGEYGPLAAPAVPALTRRIGSTPLGEEAMKSLGKIGPAARLALPKLIREFERTHTGYSSKGVGYNNFVKGRMNRGCIAMLKGIGKPAATAIARLFLKENEQPYDAVRYVLKAYEGSGRKLSPILMTVFDDATAKQLSRFSLELAKMGPWLPSLKKPLLTRLASESKAQRHGAAVALAFMNALPRESHSLLLEAVKLKDPQSLNAALMLGRLSKEFKWAIPILLDAYVHGSSKDKRRSEAALTSIKRAEKGQNSFAFLLSHPKPNVALAAAYFLAKKQASQSDLEKATRFLVDFVLRVAKVNDQPSWGSVAVPKIDRTDAQFAIAEGFPRSEAILKAAIKSEDDPARRRALLLVYRFDPDRAQRIKRAKTWLLTHEDPLIRREMVYLLNREKAALKDILPTLAKALDDRDYRVRASVRFGVSQSSEKDVIPLLVKALDSSLKETRDFAQKRLIALKSLKDVTNQQLAPLLKSPKPHLKSAAKTILDTLFKKL